MQRGNIAEAVRAYDDVRVLLREELGTTPGPELVALHERLLAPAPVARRRAKPTGLLERDAELAEIAAALQRLARGEGGVLAFEGPAGIGKTRLLGVLRERALDAGADGPRRARRRARARVRLRRRAPALRGRRRDASRRRPARAPSSAREPRPTACSRCSARSFSYTATLAAAAPARALHRRPAVERHRVAALRRLPDAPHRRAAGAGGDDDPHRRAGLRRAAAGRDRAGPRDRRRPAAAADRGRHRGDGLRPCSARPTTRSPPPARRSPPATRCCCASC